MPLSVIQPPDLSASLSASRVLELAALVLRDSWQQGAREFSAYDCRKPQLTVEGLETVEVENGKRLVLAIEQDAKVDILHACGGNARCTTCRVEFTAGEPAQMTAAEQRVLAAKGATGVRLSCQILCDHDMTVRAISRLEGSGRADAGGPPASEIAPTPEWIPKA